MILVSFYIYHRVVKSNNKSYHQLFNISWFLCLIATLFHIFALILPILFIHDYDNEILPNYVIPFKHLFSFNYLVKLNP